MKHKVLLSALALALCLLLCACMQPGGNQTDLPPDGTEGPGVQDTTPTPPEDNKDENRTDDSGSTPLLWPDELTLELVVAWENADAILTHLDELSDKLREALTQCGCPPERVTLTISTAGGFTAQALADGGIDAAILPAEDIIPLETSCAIIALSGEDIPAIAIAVSLADDMLSPEFRSALLNAFTTTDAGEEFISLCCDGAFFAAPTEEAMQAMRDYLAELEEDNGDQIQ